MQKKIEFEKGNLIIGYCDNLQDISVYVSEQFTEPIKISFVPKIEMDEKYCLEFTNKHMIEIILEAKKIIQENDEFYKNFEISFYSEFTGYSLYRHKLNRNILIVASSSLNVDCKLKNNLY
jgi:hypothetical protein